MPVSQANWSYMIFTAGNLFPSHSCIDVTRVKPPLGFKPMSLASNAEDLPTELSPRYLYHSCLLVLLISFFSPPPSHGPWDCLLWTGQNKVMHIIMFIAKVTFTIFFYIHVIVLFIIWLCVSWRSGFLFFFQSSM